MTNGNGALLTYTTVAASGGATAWLAQNEPWMAWIVGLLAAISLGIRIYKDMKR